MKLKRLIVCAAVALFPFVGSSHAALINGNFETGDFTGWTASGNVVVEDFYGGSNGPHTAAFNGANLPPNGFIEQTFATLIGQPYLLQFDYGVYAIAASGSQSLTVSVLGTTPLLEQTVSNSHSANPVQFSTFSFGFTADDISSTLRFADVSTNNTIAMDGLVDNVQIAAIPEPSTYALMLAGLGIVGFVARRRRKGNPVAA